MMQGLDISADWLRSFFFKCIQETRLLSRWSITMIYFVVTERFVSRPPKMEVLMCGRAVEYVARNRAMVYKQADISKSESIAAMH
jgi:hypothetical protein